MYRSLRLAIIAIALLLSAAPAQARIRLIDPWGHVIRPLQQMVDKGHLPQPTETIKVWPLSSLPGGDALGIGGLDFWGQRPFLISLGSHPSPDELWHELGHVVDDGWQTPAQRCMFEHVFAFGPPDAWFTPNGADEVSDNWAQAYAVFSIYGRRAPLALLRSWTGIRGPNMAAVRGHLYGWIDGIARRSATHAAAATTPQQTSSADCF